MRLILHGCLLALLVTVSLSKSDDSAGFFLKVTKNVPRLGRRSDSQFEKLFRKAAKSVPRIGRRSEYVDSSSPDDEFNSWFDQLVNPSKRRMMRTSQPPTTSSFYEYNVVQPVNTHTLYELLSKDDLPTDTVKFVHWKDFDSALQNDQELYSKIISLGKSPDHRLKDDLRSNKILTMYSNSMDDDLMIYGGDNGLMNDKERQSSYYNNNNSM